MYGLGRSIFVCVGMDLFNIPHTVICMQVKSIPHEAKPFKLIKLTLIYNKRVIQS